MPKPFHLSFVVSDLEAAKSFYIEVLGCSLGRNSGTWVDILFFGHQLAIHQERENLSAVAIDHFGSVLTKPEWLALSERIGSRSIGFRLEPRIENEGTPNESGKFVIQDPASNILEFKYYANFNDTVGNTDA